MHVLVSVKKSEYDRLKERGQIDNHVQEFLGGKSARLEKIIKDHLEQKESVKIIKETLEAKGIQYKLLDPELVAEDIHLLGNKPDLVIAAGGDGTVLRTAQYLIDEPLLGIKADKSSVGYLCGLKEASLLKDALEKTLPRNKVHRIQAKINGKVVNNPYFLEEYAMPYYALNEIYFPHENPGMSNVYEINEEWDRSVKSSGIIMSTAAGSTGFISKYGGQKMNLTDARIQYVPRSTLHETPQFNDKLHLTNYSFEGKLIYDGSRYMIDVPFAAKIEIFPGKPLTLLGRIRD